MPNAITPTPMAVPGASHPPAGRAKPKKPAKPKPKPKPKAKPKAQAKPSAPPHLGTFPAFTPSPASGFPTGILSPYPGLTPAPHGKPRGSATPGFTFTPVPTGSRNGRRPARGNSGFGSPVPTPTPQHPRAQGGGRVLFGWGGLSNEQKTLRYGDTLELRPAPNFHGPIQLLAVDPGSHEDAFKASQLTRFPRKLTHYQKLLTLGDPGHFLHLNWVIAQGYSLDMPGEGFLRLYDNLNGGGAGYLWPLHFLFYVVITPPGRGQEVYYRLLVTVTKG